MNKLLTFLILGIFLISFASAADFDNVKYQKDKTFDNKDIKDYKLLQKYKPIEIKNLLGLGSTLFEGYLSQHDDSCGTSCQSTIEIKLHKDEVLIDDVIFKTLQEDNSWVEQDVRSYQFKYWGNINDYETQCKDKGKSENGTKIQECNSVKVGSHEGWINYNLGDKVDAGIYTIKLDAEKKPSRTVDWIIETNGEWLESWAVWGTQVYDIFDSVYNTTLWENASTGLASNRFVTETNNYLTVYTQGANPTAPGDNYFQTKLLNNSLDTNLSMRVILNVSKAVMNTNGYANSSLYVFGNEIKRINCTGVSSCSDSDDSNYIITKNFTDDKFYVYDDGIFLKSFTASDSLVKLYVAHESDDSVNLAKAQGILYGINYEESRITLNSPTNNNISQTNEVQFNCSATVTGGSALTNMSLWTNESGSWEIRNTTNFEESFEDNGATLSSTLGGQVSKHGMKILTKSSSMLNTISKSSTSTATKAYLTNTSMSILASASFVGNNATFSYTLANDTLYYVLVDNDGATYTDSYTTTFANPTVGDTIDWITAWNGATDTSSRVYNIQSITLGSATSSTTQTFNRTLTDTTLWSCQACDSDGDCGFALENRTVSIDTTAPTITIESPTGIYDYGSQGASETLNVTFTDSNLDTCWYSYNGTNTTIDGCQTGVKNSTTFTLQRDVYTMTTWANDSVGNINSSTTTWDYKVFANSQNYDNTTLGGTISTFDLNATLGSGIVLSVPYLVYNDTAYGGTFSQTGSDIFTSVDITIPFVSTQTNITFYWTLRLSDNTFINASSYNQTINPLGLDDCSVHSNQIFNFTVYDEEELTEVDNATIEYIFSIYNADRSSLLLNISGKKETNPLLICTGYPLTNLTQYSLDYILKFYSNDTIGSGNLTYIDARYYNMLNFNLTNSTVPQTIELYEITESNSTKFQITFRDSTMALSSDTLIYVQRQYVSENVWRDVEVPLTDSNGQAVVNLVKNTVLYNLIMIDVNRNILASFTDITAFCDESFGTCNLQLNAPSTVTSVYNFSEATGLSYSRPTYSDTTKLISLSFSSINASNPTVRMVVTSENQFQNRTVCNSSLQSSVGVLTCNVSSRADIDKYLFVEVYSNNIFVGTYSISLIDESIGGFFGINGTFLAFFLILLIICMFSDDRQVLTLMLGVGWVSCIFLGLINGSILGLGAGGMWLIVTIIIFIWKLKNEEFGGTPI